MKRRMTKLQSFRARAASHQRELSRNPHVQRVLKGRELGPQTLLMLMRHFASLPPSGKRNSILGSLDTLRWLAEQIERRTRIRLVATRSVMAKMLQDADAHFRAAALAEFERLVQVMASVMDGAEISDPGATLNDLLMLRAIIDEIDKAGTK